MERNQLRRQTTVMRQSLFDQVFLSLSLSLSLYLAPFFSFQINNHAWNPSLYIFKYSKRYDLALHILNYIYSNTRIYLRVNFGCTCTRWKKKKKEQKTNQSVVRCWVFQGLVDEQFVQLEELQDDANPNFVEEVATLYYRDSSRLIHNIEQALWV